MQSATSIDTRLVLRIYAWVVLTISIVFAWFWFGGANIDLPGVPYGRAGLIRTSASALGVFGFAAVGMSRIENPASRQRALWWFAMGHLYFGLLFEGQASAVFPDYIPYPIGWLPLIAGIVLMFIALTCAHAPKFAGRFRFSPDEEEPQPHVVMLRERGPQTSPLQSQYEEQIRLAARGEERARLARDLHDAVKQQLFAIQTSAATVQERMAADRDGAQSALEQVRACARDAMSEMKALIEQLQAAPIENTGLVSALQQQCEALGLRTGAAVKLNVGILPPHDALPPGTQQALFRAAQEALSNVARHARATEVTVWLGLKRDRLELTIRDNGAGFDGQEITPGMGLKNMSARLHEVSGQMLISPGPAGGTLVGFSVPCDLDTARDYAKRAALAAGVVALMAFNLTFGDRWEQPWSAIIAAIALVTAARYLAAWRRTRGRTDAALA